MKSLSEIRDKGPIRNETCKTYVTCDMLSLHVRCGRWLARANSYPNPYPHEEIPLCVTRNPNSTSTSNSNPFSKPKAISNPLTVTPNPTDRLVLMYYYGY